MSTLLGWTSRARKEADGVYLPGGGKMVADMGAEPGGPPGSLCCGSSRKEGLSARAGYLSSLLAFEATFPELVHLYTHLCEMAGNSDLASRFLSMYCPPPYMSGCSQVAWTKDQPALIRNYDYSPLYFEGVVMKTNWLKPVIGMSDCTWGLLDGINGDGLAASLTFGGRKITGKGFGPPHKVRPTRCAGQLATARVPRVREVDMSWARGSQPLSDALGH